MQWISLIAIITEQLMRTLEKAGGSDPQVVHAPYNAHNASIKRPFPMLKSYLEFSSCNLCFQVVLVCIQTLNNAVDRIESCTVEKHASIAYISAVVSQVLQQQQHRHHRHLNAHCRFHTYCGQKEKHYLRLLTLCCEA